jgi:hypothetical protein
VAAETPASRATSASVGGAPGAREARAAADTVGVADTAGVAEAAGVADSGGVADAAMLAIRVTDISSATLGSGSAVRPLPPYGEYWFNQFVMMMKPLQCFREAFGIVSFA